MGDEVDKFGGDGDGDGSTESEGWFSWGVWGWLPKLWKFEPN